MLLLGKCPFCEGNVHSHALQIRGVKVLRYACEHAKKERDINNDYLFAETSTCRYEVYSNAFLRWNKRSLGEKEMKHLLSEGQITLRLHGKKGSSEYFKYAIPDREYGISILWDEPVNESYM